MTKKHKYRFRDIAAKHGVFFAAKVMQRLGLSFDLAYRTLVGRWPHGQA